MSAHAFKEWHVIVQALGAGEQILILRKGGIAEGRGGFSVRSDRFWLFPTAFHAQLAKTKPAAARFFTEDTPPTDTVTLSYFAEVAVHRFLTDWSAVAALAPWHLLTEATVKERFTWSKPPGLHVLAVRVYRAAAPITLPVTGEMGGCKSWVEVPIPLPSPANLQPALADSAFYELLGRISL